MESAIKGIETIKEMVKIVAELTRQGITFVVTCNGMEHNRVWTIELTGGH